MIRPPRLLVCFGLLLTGCLAAVGQDFPTKPALKHSDYDIWNTSGGFKLAPDGKTFAYTLTPPTGDAAIVIRDIPSGKETRLATAGRRNPAAGAAPAEPALSGPILFSPDAKFLFVALAPTQSELAAARSARKKPSDMPKPVLAVYDIAAGKVTSKLDNVRSYAVAETGAGFLLMTKSAGPSDDAAVAAAAGNAIGAGNAEAGNDLVIRNLADGKDTTVENVVSYSVLKDDKQLLLTLAGKAAKQSGLFVADLADPAKRTTIFTGRGRPTNLTWDEEQTKLAFFHAEPVKGSETAKPAVHLWERNKPDAAKEVVAYKPEGLDYDNVLTERGNMSFTRDGLKLVVGVAPETKPEPKAATPAPAAETPRGPRPGGGRAGAGPRGARAAGTAPTPAAGPDKIELDLWHWKDETLQPTQKIRSAQDRLKRYQAVYFLDSKEFKQLDTDDINVAVPNYGDWAIATSNKAYRGQLQLNPSPRDVALVNIRTGEGKPLITAHEDTVTSPYGNYALTFDGKDWISYAVPSGQKVNLTAKLGVPFVNEDHDTPNTPRAYGTAGFTADRKSVLLRDRYDIWQVPLDGTPAANVTKIGRELKTTFSLVRLEEDDDLLKIDLGKPWMLSATNRETEDQGYYLMEPGAKPKLLLMAARDFGPLTKAKDAETLVMTAQTFASPPDYYATSVDFKELKKITDLQPRHRDFNWATAELINYKSSDGVPLRGMLVKPENFDPTKKYPMIVYIYERLSSGVHRFRLPSAGTSINPTYYASNGYLVYMPDIAYTTGSPGQSALKCVMPAIQAVADKGFVNEKAIGIQGHSWGGYQIAYLITQTDRFAAASAGAPVANMTSAYGGIRWGTGLSRQFQYEKTQSRIGATLWESPLKYIDNSPVFYADRVNTPLMMLHNDQDDAVPWYQGIEYYMALRRLDKEVYLFNYNGEFHGLRKKINQQDYTMRMKQFFDCKLKGAPAPAWMEKGIPYNDRDKEKEQWKKLFNSEKPKAPAGEKAATGW